MLLPSFLSLFLSENLARAVSFCFYFVFCGYLSDLCSHPLLEILAASRRLIRLAPRLACLRNNKQAIHYGLHPISPLVIATLFLLATCILLFLGARVGKAVFGGRALVFPLSLHRACVLQFCFIYRHCGLMHRYWIDIVPVHWLVWEHVLFCPLGFACFTPRSHFSFHTLRLFKHFPGSLRFRSRGTAGSKFIRAINYMSTALAIKAG